MGARRGQANVITVLILISVTLALAIAMYAYFVGVYNRQAQQQQMIQVATTYATSIPVTLDLFSNTTTSTGYYLYCGLFTVRNMGGQEYTPLFALLPALPGGTTLVVQPQIYRVPLDYQVTPPLRDARLWLAIDFDQDGIVDMVGGTFGNLRIVLNRTANCSEIYNNNTLKTSDLAPALVKAQDVIVDPPTGLRLLELVRQAYPTAPDDFEIPAWQVPLRPGQRYSLFFYIESPVRLGGLSIVMLAPFNNVYLLAQTVTVFSG